MMITEKIQDNPNLGYSLLNDSTGFAIAARKALNSTDANAITTHITTEITNTSAEMLVL